MALWLPRPENRQIGNRRSVGRNITVENSGRSRNSITEAEKRFLKDVSGSVQYNASTIQYTTIN